MISELYAVKNLDRSLIFALIASHNNSNCPFRLNPQFKACQSNDTVDIFLLNDYQNDNKRSLVITTDVPTSSFLFHELISRIQNINMAHLSRFLKRQFYCSWPDDLLVFITAEDNNDTFYFARKHTSAFFMTVTTWVVLLDGRLLQEEGNGLSGMARFAHSSVILALLFHTPEYSVAVDFAPHHYDYDSILYGSSEQQVQNSNSRKTSAELLFFVHWLLIVGILRASVAFCLYKFEESKVVSCKLSNDQETTFLERLYFLRYLTIALICLLVSITYLVLIVTKGHIISPVSRIIFLLDGQLAFIECINLVVIVLLSYGIKRDERQPFALNKLKCLSSFVHIGEGILTALQFTTAMIYGLFYTGRWVMVLALAPHVFTMTKQILVTLARLNMRYKNFEMSELYKDALRPFNIGYWHGLVLLIFESPLCIRKYCPMLAWSNKCIRGPRSLEAKNG
ncbi:hypothetical protein DdX_01138 [Ditylenchus destructor]|uniref:Uncharacterized protein n=1 Tax=Ditylenchus destructor TaxID=166010 RepID=A0AAD4RB06_9BILA|nr:hypothetical protein DdX_01138 [Ditylenchus destructor]